MKKYLLVSLTILFAASFVWAQNATTAEPSVDIEADATLSWGFDLGPGGAKHGFKNEASWSVKFPLLKKANKTSTKSDVPVYGEVTLTDVGLNLISEKDSGGRFALDGKVGGLEAKLVIYGAYLTVFDTPDFYTNYAEIWTPVDKNKKYRPQNYRFKPGFDGYGTKIGYANKDFMDLDVGVKFGSSSNYDPNDASETHHKKYFDGNTALGNKEYIMVTEKGKIIQEVSKEEYDKAAPVDQVPPGLTAAPYYIYKVGEFSVWKSGKEIRFPDAGWYSFKKDNDADPDTYQYSVGVDFSIKPLDKMLALAFAVNTTFGGSYDKDANLNFGVAATSEPVDGLKLKAGFDGAYYFNYSNSKFKWDTVFTAQYKWIGAGVYVAEAGTKVGGTRTDMAIFAQFETKGDKKDATNLVEGLDAGAYVGMYRLLANLNAGKVPFFAKVWGAYTININDSMWVAPFADVWLETNHNTYPLALAYDVGVTFSPVEKVEVEAAWNHGTINKNTHAGVIEKSVIGLEHYGQFVLSLKIIY